MLGKIVHHLEEFLDHGKVGDYPGAHNGLQIENSGRVSRICGAVDACEAVFGEAANVPGTLLLVHHGLLWGGAQPFSGGLRRKLKRAFDADLAVFSSHLPLDLHRTLGNNVLLAKAVGLRGCVPAFEAKGQDIGLIGGAGVSRVEFSRRLAKATGGQPHLAPGGPSRVQRVGIVTGGAGDMVSAAARLGCDTFVTGEGPHHTFTLAEELGVNLFYGGHYATETLGVKALAMHVARKFRLKWEFIEHPTGL